MIHEQMRTELVDKIVEMEKVGPTAVQQGAPVEPTTYARATKTDKWQTRSDRQPVDRVASRSKSRATKRTKIQQADNRAEEHRPAFVVKPMEGINLSVTSNVIWKKVVSKKVMPRCQTITTKRGKVVIKSLNKETADVLRSLVKDSGALQDEALLWPRDPV